MAYRTNLMANNHHVGRLVGVFPTLLLMNKRM